MPEIARVDVAPGDEPKPIVTKPAKGNKPKAKTAAAVKPVAKKAPAKKAAPAAKKTATKKPVEPKAKKTGRKGPDWTPAEDEELTTLVLNPDLGYAKGVRAFAAKHPERTEYAVQCRWQRLRVKLNGTR